VKFGCLFLVIAFVVLIFLIGTRTIYLPGDFPGNLCELPSGVHGVVNADGKCEAV
jgi:hypothetical protein